MQQPHTNMIHAVIGFLRAETTAPARGPSELRLTWKQPLGEGTFEVGERVRDLVTCAAGTRPGFRQREATQREMSRTGLRARLENAEWRNITVYGKGGKVVPKNEMPEPNRGALNG